MQVFKGSKFSKTENVGSGLTVALKGVVVPMILFMTMNDDLDGTYNTWFVFDSYHNVGAHIDITMFSTLSSKNEINLNICFFYKENVILYFLKYF